jgi:hypothetical protein
MGRVTGPILLAPSDDLGVQINGVLAASELADRAIWPLPRGRRAVQF